MGRWDVKLPNLTFGNFIKKMKILVYKFRSRYLYAATQEKKEEVSCTSSSDCFHRFAGHKFPTYKNVWY